MKKVLVSSSTNLNLRFTTKQKLACEGLLTNAECKAALSSFKLNKSSGCEGAEFYNEFWEDIGEKLVECLNYGLKRGSIALSQRRRVITLLEKKGKDTSMIKKLTPSFFVEHRLQDSHKNTFTVT